MIGAFVLVYSVSIPSAAYPRPGDISRVSVASNGAQGDGHSGGGDRIFALSQASMTPNARYIAFSSDASNLKPGDTNQLPDIFVKDMKTGGIEIISNTAYGTPGIQGGPCDGSFGAQAPAISNTGRYVAFESCFDNLVPGDTNVSKDIFVHDRRTGQTLLASSPSREGSSPAGQADSHSSLPTISADGRFVAFQSRASNLDPRVCPDGPKGLLGLPCNYPFALRQVYVHDMNTGSTEAVGVNADGELGDGQSYHASISADGRYVAFTSRARNLVSNDHNVCINSSDSCQDVFLRDLKKNKTELISVGITGESANGPSGETWFTHGMISADNRYVTFDSSARDLVPSGAGGMFVRDREVGRTERVSVDSTGQPLAANYPPTMSSNGRFVAYYWAKPCPNSPPGMNPSQFAVFDRLTGANEDGASDLEGGEPSCASGRFTIPTQISSDGRYVTFSSNANDLVADDTNQCTFETTSNCFDVFFRDRGLDLSVGDLTRRVLSVSKGGSTLPPRIASATDEANDIDARATSQGLNIINASLTLRPRLDDLFAAIDLIEMPRVVSHVSPIFYGLRFKVDGKNYEVRASSLNFGTFRLFDCTDTQPLCMKDSDLRGGFGTTGMRVVFSLPLNEIGLETGGELSDVVAFSAIGNALTGATRVVDYVKFRWR